MKSLVIQFCKEFELASMAHNQGITRGRGGCIGYVRSMAFSQITVPSPPLVLTDHFHYSVVYPLNRTPTTQTPTISIIDSGYMEKSIVFHSNHSFKIQKYSFAQEDFVPFSPETTFICCPEWKRLPEQGVITGMVHTTMNQIHVFWVNRDSLFHHSILHTVTDRGSRSVKSIETRVLPMVMTSFVYDSANCMIYALQQEGYHRNVWEFHLHSKNENILCRWHCAYRSQIEQYLVLGAIIRSRYLLCIGATGEIWNDNKIRVIDVETRQMMSFQSKEIQLEYQSYNVLHRNNINTQTLVDGYLRSHEQYLAMPLALRTLICVWTESRGTLVLFDHDWNKDVEVDEDTIWCEIRELCWADAQDSW